ncbi:hypothetical protein ACLB2K_025946 [Fragaria x ananassa]
MSRFLAYGNVRRVAREVTSNRADNTVEAPYRLCREIYLAVLFSPCIAMTLFKDFFGTQFRKKWLHVVRQTLEKAGPAFIKWGQWAAARPDLFPRDLCAELEKLHSKAPAHSFDFTKCSIEKTFGRKLPEIFEKFDEEPVASGSVAQVHQVILKYRYPGRKIKPILVAVMVRHPGVVETYEHGESVQHYVDELEGNEPIRNALAHIGTNALLKMLLVDNFIHADMHPGNILVRVTRSKIPRKQLFRLRPQVVFLDVGMTAELSKRDQLNLVELFKAVALRDGRSVAECTLRLSGQQNCPNPSAFIEEVDKSFELWDSPEGEIIHPGDSIQQLLEQVRRHKVRIDGNVCTVIVTTLVLEGWQRKLDPGYDMMHTLQTLLFKADWAESFSYTIEGLIAP